MKYIFWVIAFILFVIAGMLFFVSQLVPSYVLLVIGGVFILLAVLRQGRFSLKLTPQSGNEELDRLQQESFAKAIRDYNSLEEAVARANDRDLRRQLQKMQGIAKKMLYYLQQNPDRLSLAHKFIDYYQDRAVLLVNQYFELEETGLQTGHVSEMKARIKETLNSFDEAYEAQFERVLHAQIVDLDAELKVMKQSLSADGVEDQTGSRFGKTRTAASGNGGRGLSFDDLLQKGAEYMGRRTEAAADGGSSDFSVVPPGMRGTVIRRKIVAAMLGIFFGSFGAHKFYLGKFGWGILHLIFCWTLIPGLIGIYEGIRYLLMSVDDFYFRYCQK